MSQPRETPLAIVPAYSASAVAKGYGVKLSGTGADEVAIGAANSDVCLGVVQSAIPAGGRGSVATQGMAIAKSGAAITRTNEVELDATGRFVPVTTGRGVGIANTAAGGAGEDFELYLHGPGGITAQSQGVIQERKITVAHGDLTDADGSQDINLGAILPARAQILGVSFSAFTVFAGGGVTLTLDIGSSGDPDAIKDGVDLATAAVDGQPATQTNGVHPNKQFLTATQLVARFLGAGGNVEDLTSGTVTIHVAFVQLPA